MCQFCNFPDNRHQTCCTKVMARRSISSGFPVSKPLDSNGALLVAAPPSDTTNASPTVGGPLAPVGVWRLLEGKPEADLNSVKLPAGKPKAATAMPTTKLLIVDGETAQLKILCENLEPYGYSATCMTSAMEALAALRERRFDLVLTDLNMAEMDGIAFLRSAREI